MDRRHDGEDGIRSGARDAGRDESVGEESQRAARVVRRQRASGARRPLEVRRRLFGPVDLEERREGVLHDAALHLRPQLRAEPHRPPPRATQCVSAAEQRAGPRRVRAERGRDVTVKKQPRTQRATEVTKGACPPLCLSFVSSVPLVSSFYIELHAASAFSFLQGASLPEALIDRAAELEYPALALLDRDGVYGLPRFHKAALAAGIRPIVGAELTLSDTGPTTREHRSVRSELACLGVLCETQEGYRNLCRLITMMKLRAPKGEGALALEEFEGRTQGLVALVGRAALDTRRFGVGGLLDRLVGLFGRDRVYVELQRHHRREEEAHLQALVQMASAFRVPTVATNGVR